MTQFLSNLTLLLLFLKFKDSAYFMDVGLGYLMIPMLLIAAYHIVMMTLIRRSHHIGNEILKRIEEIQK